MPDVIVVGGGVIGLSIAWELAGNGLSVRVLEQSAIGREASWAGAGMLPPGRLENAHSAEARLRGATNELWPNWSNALTSLTGIDNGYLKCGGVEVLLNNSDNCRSKFQRDLEQLKSEGVLIETTDVAEICQRMPDLSPEIVAAYWMPEFCQVRNPRHLQSLQAGCVMRGVELVPGARVGQIEFDCDRIVAVHAGESSHRAAEFVFANGAWASDLLRPARVNVSIEPVKGQIVLLQAVPLPFRSVIQVGSEYLVPRNDGRILIGSTEERTGFDKRTSAEAIGGLIAFAQRLVPILRHAHFEQCWAGLRPCSRTGRPYIGRLPEFRNASIAAGHFRHGLHLSPITAVLIRQILLGQPVMLPAETSFVG